MSHDPPPPYPGGPTAPLLEEKSGAPQTPGRTSPAVMQPPPGMSLPPADIGPPKPARAMAIFQTWPYNGTAPVARF
ncbi:cell death inducing p53 target 1 [Phyllostomus discolor]|uniref:Cell death inducing p53 target 1 n=1 Tax=Phyllostomus discolor TaxID=89673 RepID=A0A834B567_9CHIR|nr:cell death inducing p53 target 1 [Phyllostomus discolor]